MGCCESRPVEEQNGKLLSEEKKSHLKNSLSSTDNRKQNAPLLSPLEKSAKTDTEISSNAKIYDFKNPPTYIARNFEVVKVISNNSYSKTVIVKQKRIGVTRAIKEVLFPKNEYEDVLFKEATKLKTIVLSI